MPIYKDKKRGTYYVKLYQTDPVTGKYIQKTKRGFKKKCDAQEWEANQTLSKAQHTRATFGDMFEENLKYLNSSDTSAKMKRSWLTLHFPFMNEPIESLTKPQMIEWRNSLEQSGLAKRTINRGLGYVRSVFTYSNAIYNTENTGAVIRSYKIGKADKREMQTWTPQEFEQFIQCVPEGYYRAFFVWQYWMGTRRGEGMAVRKEDITGKRVRIWHQIKHFSNGFDELKTGTSERTLGIDDITYEYLKPYIRDACPFVFGGVRSLPITNIQRELEKGIAASGVKPIRLHDLRHSHASNLIAEGVPIIAVSKRLGHASITITLDTYAHLLERTEDEMMATINAFRQKEKASPMGIETRQDIRKAL